MMRAAVCTEYGPPEVVQVRDVEVPEIAADELLVRVTTSTVNRTCAEVRACQPPFAIRPAYGMRRPRRPILGTDFAGVVEAVGAEVRDHQVGDRVFGFDDTRMGGHGEFLAIGAAKGVIAIPDGVTDEDAAASVEGVHYAMAGIDRANLAAGKRALVYGGGGAIGTALVQLLVSRKVDVVAVAEGHQAELMLKLGASRAIDYRAEDFTAIGETFDLVSDAVGKTTFGVCRQLVAPGGRFMSTELGPRLQNLWLPATTRWSDRRVVFAFPTKIREHVKVAARELAEGTFSPVIDRRFALDDIVEAYRYVDTATKTGNVVLTVGSAS